MQSRELGINPIIIVFPSAKMVHPCQLFKGINIHVSALGKSCLEIKTKAPGSASGVYAISATNIGKEFLKVFCDMTTDEGNVTALYSMIVQHIIICFTILSLFFED